MPNLIDIAQRLAERPMVALLHEERCLPERDLGSTCTRCAEACPVDAIAVGLERDTEAVARRRIRVRGEKRPGRTAHRR